MAYSYLLYLISNTHVHTHTHTHTHTHHPAGDQTQSPHMLGKYGFIELHCWPTKIYCKSSWFDVISVGQGWTGLFSKYLFFIVVEWVFCGKELTSSWEEQRIAPSTGLILPDIEMWKWSSMPASKHGHPHAATHSRRVLKPPPFKDG